MLRRRGHHLGGVVVRLGLIEIDLRVVALLAESLRERAAARGALEQLPRRRFEISGRDDPVDETPVGCGGCVDRVARQQELECALAPDRTRDGDHRRVAEPAAAAAGRGEAGFARRHREIAGGDELAARRGGEPGHAREHRLRDPLDPLHHLGAAHEQRSRAGEIAAGHVGEVMACAEHGPLRVEQHAARLARADLRERREEILNDLKR